MTQQSISKTPPASQRTIKQTLKDAIDYTTALSTALLNTPNELTQVLKLAQENADFHRVFIESTEHRKLSRSEYLKTFASVARDVGRDIRQIVQSPGERFMNLDHPEALTVYSPSNASIAPTLEDAQIISNSRHHTLQMKYEEGYEFKLAGLVGFIAGSLITNKIQQVEKELITKVKSFLFDLQAAASESKLVSNSQSPVFSEFRTSIQNDTSEEKFLPVKNINLKDYHPISITNGRGIIKFSSDPKFYTLQKVAENNPNFSTDLGLKKEFTFKSYHAPTQSLLLINCSRRIEPSDQRASFAPKKIITFEVEIIHRRDERSCYVSTEDKVAQREIYKLLDKIYYSRVYPEAKQQELNLAPA